MAATRDEFRNRHIGPDADDQAEMLKALGRVARGPRRPRRT